MKSKLLSIMKSNHGRSQCSASSELQLAFELELLFYATTNDFTRNAIDAALSPLYYLN